MGSIRIEALTCGNFRPDSLDGFIRRQEVSECWHNVSGDWQLQPVSFTEEWALPRLRAEAADLLHAMDDGRPVIGAFDDGRVIGYAQLGECLGSRSQYRELTAFHVSAPYRGQGIGRQLFAAACDAARGLGAEKLYISAHSSKESQAAYRALGCILAQEPDPAHVAAEPFDVQMEYDLWAVQVRFGKLDDLPSWMTLVRRVAWNFPGLETEEALQAHADTVAKFIRNGNAFCAVQGGTVVGVLLFSRRLNMLCCMAVAPEYRQRGTAQRMFDLMLTIADPARDLTVTTFRTGDPKGDAPRAFYSKNGFVPAELVMENNYPCQVFVRKAEQHD